MNSTIKTLFFAILLFAAAPKAGAQGWCQDRTSMYSLGLGGTQVLFLPTQYYGIGNAGSVAMALNISGEYKVHRLIGIGWQTGLDLFASGYYRNRADGLYYSSVVVGVPIGFKFNFHILEATQAQIKDRLDVYAGINVGGEQLLPT